MWNGTLKTSFERKPVLSALPLATKLSMGLINRGDYGERFGVYAMYIACVSSVGAVLVISLTAGFNT